MAEYSVKDRLFVLDVAVSTWPLLYGADDMTRKTRAKVEWHWVVSVWLEELWKPVNSYSVSGLLNFC